MLHNLTVYVKVMVSYFLILVVYIYIDPYLIMKMKYIVIDISTCLYWTHRILCALYLKSTSTNSTSNWSSILRKFGCFRKWTGHLGSRRYHKEARQGAPVSRRPCPYWVSRAWWDTAAWRCTRLSWDPWYWACYNFYHFSDQMKRFQIDR